MTMEEFCGAYSVERRGTGCLKWDALEERFGDPELTALWVADMDFKVAGSITDALQKSIDHGVYGYPMVPRGYYEAFLDWQRQRHGYEVQKEWLRASPGVVTGLYWLIQAFTEPGDAVLIQTPVYYPFHNVVKDTGRCLVWCDLQNTDGYYTMDMKAVEAAILRHDVKLMIHCSPHNPVGRVWSEQESKDLLELCRRYGVLVISDEIHQDIIPDERRQIPAAAVAEGRYADHVVTVTSASKTFNLAGFFHAQLIIQNESLRDQYDSFIKAHGHCEPGTLAMIATKAAYEGGAPWLEGLHATVRHNYQIMKEKLERSLPGVVVSPLEGTYLMWIDLRALLKPEEVKPVIQDRCRLAVDFGEWFGESGAGFIRLNLATHPRYIEQAADSLVAQLSSK